MNANRLSFTALAALAVAASPAAASTFANITYAAVDGWDPVVLLDIGTRQTNVTGGYLESTNATPINAFPGGGTATMSAYAEAEVGALHVSTLVDFTAGGQPGDLRSANVNAYATWSDTLSAHFPIYGAQSGYAFIKLLVNGGTGGNLASAGGPDLPFARTYGLIDVTGSNAADSVHSSVVELSNRNYISRYLNPDPAYVGDPSMFDPKYGLYFSEDPPVDWSIRQFYEGGTDYYPYPTTGPGTVVNPQIAGNYGIRIPLAAGMDTSISVRLLCESYAGATLADAAGSFCQLGHSVYWGGIDHVTDRDGNLLTGVTFGSGSGFDYAISYFDQASNTPEPASWALLIAGFGLTGAALRRRRGVPA